MFNSHHIAGVKAFHQAQFQEAKEHLLKAISCDITAESYHYLGKACFFCDEKTTAIDYLEKYLNFDKYHSSDKVFAYDIESLAYTHDLLGQCYAALGQFDNAIESYPNEMLNMAKRFAPTDPYIAAEEIRLRLAQSNPFFGMSYDDTMIYQNLYENDPKQEKKHTSELVIQDDVFNHDLRKSAYTKNPTIIPDIDLVYVLSGRTTVLGHDADHLNRPFDSEDDIERMREGIRIATQINALRANKASEDLLAEDYVTPIFYNGRAIHNKDLNDALDQGLFDYPRHLFTIRDIYPENTLGQIQSFKQYLATHSHKNVAVVSSAYHLARVLRTIGCESPQVTSDSDLYGLGELNIFLYGVHQNEARVGIKEDVIGEYQAMVKYSSGNTPSIATVQSPNVFLTDEDHISYRSWLKAMFWSKVNLNQSADSEELVVYNNRM